MTASRGRRARSTRRVRRPALPHSRASFDSLASPASRRPDRRRARPDPPRDHRPRPDRRRARGARLRRRRGARADGDRRRGGPDRRRRPDLPVPRAADPARAARRRGDRRGPRAGRPRRRPASVRPVPRLARCATPRMDAASRGQVDWIETHNARIIGRRRQRAGGRVRARARAARRRRVRRPHARSRSASPTRSSTATRRRRPGLLAALPPAELVTGRASFYVRLLTPVAKLVQRARGNGRVAAGRRVDRDGAR